MYKFFITIPLCILSLADLCGQAKPWHSGILTDEFIFEKAPFPESHAATIAETPVGLIAAWFGGTKERNPDVCIWVSSMENNKWTAPRQAADGIVNDTVRYACWNPVLYQVPGGDLLLFYKTGPNVGSWKGWLKYSKDNGLTWSAAKALPDGFLGPVKNKPVLLKNGDLLCASSTEGNGWKIHFEITRDNGETWRKIGPINDGKTFNAIQPSVLIHKDGKLQILCRSKERSVLQSWSLDNGATWSPIERSSLPNNNSGTDAVTLKDGRQLIVYNHVLPADSLKNGKGARTPLNVAISKDGKSWNAALVLEDSPISQYSYPSVIQSSDGMVHIVYTWRRQRIKYVKIDPSQLKTGQIFNQQWPRIQHLQTYEQGKEQLNYLSSLYSNKAGWEKRKAELKNCIIKTYNFPPSSLIPALKPILTPKRMMNGYSVENIALEVMPGVYIAGSLYQPALRKGKMPVILCPDGHWDKHRYREDCQIRCAMLAKMGAIVVNYDLMAWENPCFSLKEDHQRKEAMMVQTLASIRFLDYLYKLKNADTSRVAITGGSGGGSMTMQMAAIDKRIKLSVPVVMVSSFHSGGCPCESGMGIHLCGGGTLNPEIAAMAAPNPQLVISDGKDWTQHVPETEFPYLQKIYGYYGKRNLVENAHFPEEGHDYGVNKRRAMYDFIAKYFRLDIKPFRTASGGIDESGVTIEKESDMYVFGEKGERLPANAIRSFDQLMNIINKYSVPGTVSVNKNNDEEPKD